MVVIGGADGPTSIFIAGKLGNFYGFGAILVLLVFYGIYLGKMIAQKKKGIKTDQIAKGKEKGKSFYIELVMKIATYSVVLVEVISIIAGYSMLGMHGKTTGFLVACLGDIIFGMAVFTMRDSWRAGIAKKDKTRMITNGIYRYSRNPAFLGFDLVYVGILLMYCNWILLIFSLWAMIMLHLQILQEEEFLPTVFGEEYLEYKKHTFRYLGRK